MSPVYGAPTVYGSPLLYGYDVPPGPLDLARRVYGGYAPWLPSNVVGWRERCPQVGVLAADRTWRVALPGVSTGSERQVGASGSLVAADTLTLDVADPTGRYLEDGADAAVLAPGALLGLRWTVTTPAGTLTRDDQSYRVLAAPSRTRDRWGREVLRLQAEDWLRAPLRAPLGAYVLGTPGPGPTVAQQLARSPLRFAIGSVGGATWRDVVAGLWQAVAGTVTVDPATPTGGPLPLDVLGRDGVDNTWTDWLAGGWPSYGTVLESLQATFGMRSVYGPDGTPRVLAADQRQDSGYVVSASAARGGAFPVPWERVARTLAPAQFTRVELWYSWVSEGRAAAGGTAGPPDTFYVLAGSATSTHPLYPDTPPFGRTEIIMSNTAIASASGGSTYDTAATVAARRLQGYLGAADTLSLVVDCACPLPAFGAEVLVVLPDDDWSAAYRFNGATVPLGTAPASWSLLWGGEA